MDHTALVLRVDSYHHDLRAALESVDVEAVARLGTLVIDAYDRGSTIYVFGNGGSASTASHLACDFSKAPLVAGPPRPRAISLNENMALLSAWSNDDTFDVVFENQVRSLAKEGDLIIAISASGDSANVLAGVRAAKEIGALVIGLIGFRGGKLAALCDERIVVDSADYGWIESVHLCIEHYLTYLLRDHVRTVVDPNRDLGPLGASPAG